MRLRRLAAARILVPAAVAVLAAACTSTVHGTGHTRLATPSTSPDPATTTVATPPPSSGPTTPPSSGPTTLPPDFLRTPFATAIGDPATADLCAVVGTGTFGKLGVSTVTVDPIQYPPGCSLTLSNATGAVLDVSVFAARHRAPLADGRTKRTASGLDVYSYPFNTHTGGCPRDVMANQVRLVADAITRGSAAPDEQLSCAATDAMADRIAEVAADQPVPRLTLAHPSVFDLSACRVVKDAGITALSAFAHGDVLRRGFGLNCEVLADGVFLFINAAIASNVPPTQDQPVSVDGHEVYQLASHSGVCSYTSVQGSTADGKHEEVTAAATAPGDAKPPADLCGQTAQALALYLTTAGLS